MKNSILVILVLLLNACGGEAFTAEFEAVGGEAGGAAGESTAPAAGGGSTAGASSAGGAGNASGDTSNAGGAEPVVGTPAGGAAGAGGAGGTTATACEFNPAALTAALPKTLIWQSFDLAKDGMCATCGYEPCGDLKVAWSAPVVTGNTLNYQVSYANNRGAATNMRMAASSSCGTASYGMCDLTLAPAPVALTVARQDDGWRVSGAKVAVNFADDACTLSFGKPGTFTKQMDIDLEGELEILLTNLQIPCN